MSKKKKWKRKNRSRQANRQPRGNNHHHLLFQGRHWTTPYAKQLRTAMVREIPINIHNELHNVVLHDVPKPAEKLLETAWKDYQADKTIIDTLGVCQLILWLYDEIPDEAFRACMMVQYRFLSAKLMGGYN